MHTGITSGLDGAAPAATGVVLAGGESTRFSGGDKALATVGDSTLLARVVETLREATGRLPLVAVRTDAQAAAYESVLPPGVVFARDDPGAGGPLAGLLGAAAVARTPWLFVCGCDMPRLSVDAVRWVLAQGGSADAVAVAGPDGVVEPLHAGFRRSAVLAARDRVPSGGGVVALFDALDATRTVAVEDAPAGVDLAASLSNVNTRADLEALRDDIVGGE